MEFVRDNFRVLFLIVIAAALGALVVSKHMPKHTPAPHTVQTKSPLAGKAPPSWKGATRILGAASVDCRKLGLDASHCRVVPRKLTAQITDSSGRVLAKVRVARNSQFTMHAKLTVGNYTVSVSGAQLKGQTPIHVAVVPQTQPVLVVVGR